MPIIKSAKKDLRQSKKRHISNLNYKQQIRYLKKEIEKSIKAGKTAEVEELIKKFYKVTDKAAKEHVIHKNKAARLKSKAVKKIQQSHS